MRKGALAMICCAAAGAVHAQSSVTIYGFMDEGFQYTSNQGGSSAWAMSQGALGTSKWGITGNEDLAVGCTRTSSLKAPSMRAVACCCPAVICLATVRMWDWEADAMAS